MPVIEEREHERRAGGTGGLPAGPGTVADFARVPVFAIAAALLILLAFTANRFGYMGDELYFIAAGRHLSWGYVDQPPLLPLLARAMEALGPGSPFVLRIPAMLAMAAGVVFTALIARELGGRVRAQVLSAAMFGVSTVFVAGGHYLATSTLDPFLWTVLIWLLVRWIRTRRDGLLLWAGVVTAVALYVKFLIGGFWLVAGLALLVCGPRELLRRPALWGGAAIAALALVPTLVWQARHGWPQLEMGASIAQEVGQTAGGRLMWLPEVLLMAGIPAGATLLGYGLWRLLREPRLRSYRFLGWTTIGLAVVFLAVNGRSYYLAGMFPICWAVAAVELETGRASRRWRWIATWPVYVLALVLMLPGTLPVWPQTWLAKYPTLPRPIYTVAEIGWPEAARSVAGTFGRLPDPAHTAIVTGKYWAASGLDYYGPSLGLPEPASPNRGYATLATPPETARDVLYIGDDPRPLLGHFTGVQPVGAVDTGAAKPSAADGTRMWLASGRLQPWDRLWPKLFTVAS
ncbi:ArnT family glycosyltransferase [Amycolatopsis jiangsuensis]|uniref:4-amino-4-deoxy-L-arabinose transferase-like glycosyltransferase n=1 Tax=Amycolatopsis jiangsuensis TaxID=1181879 RepID=A0A840INI5_9PSEU|nr:glycosyltransferase family 39 protein [Amycolatopsis jiangsuensis]MBB4682937.1 4-amino-4-deoxy-L-arabinose transferase-like glycosyltransferase [Amycolatopsis jiangsuensis]